MAILGSTVVLGFGDVGIKIDVNPKIDDGKTGKLVFRNLVNPTTGPKQKISTEDFDKDLKRISIIYDRTSAALLRDAFAAMVERFDKIEQRRLQAENS